MAKPIIPWIGGKQKLAKWIISHFTEHDCFVDVFGGSGAILLAKEPSKCEVFNDINENIYWAFKWARDDPAGIYAELQMYPYSRKLYHETLEKLRKPDLDTRERAIMFLLHMRMAFGGKFAGGFSTSKVSNPTKRFELFKRIFPFAERFRSVVIEQLDYAEAINKYDSERTLFYLDPPYHIPRADSYYVSEGWEGGKEYYRLAEVLADVRGKWIMSNYETPLLQELFPEGRYRWERKEVTQTTSYDKKSGKQAFDKRVEVLIMNFF